MDKTVRKVPDLKEQRMENYRYWQSRPIAERMEAVADIVRTAYRMRGTPVESLPFDKTPRKVVRPGWIGR